MRSPSVSRLSRISQYCSTKEAFQPLRRSIQKSFHTSSHSLSISRSTSRLKQKIQPLNAFQAQRILKEVHIPADPSLIATNNLQLVKDKKFRIINVEEKEYHPITFEELNNERDLYQHEEIVYGVASKHIVNPSVYYGSQLQKHNIRTNDISESHVIGQLTGRAKQLELSYAEANKNSRIDNKYYDSYYNSQSLTSPKNKEVYYRQYIAVKNPSFSQRKIQSKPIINYNERCQGNIHCNQNASFMLNNYKRNNNIHVLTNKNNNKNIHFTKEQGAQNKFSQKPKKKQHFYYNMQNKTNNNNSQQRLHKESIINKGFKRYEFCRQFSTKKSDRSQEQKYNLFNALDEPFNKGLKQGLFKQNELISQKYDQSVWRK